MSEPSDSKLIKASTNEWTLLSWRAGVAIMSALGLAWLADIRSSQSAIVEKFTAFQLSNEARLGRVEGQLGELKGSVGVHRDRIIEVEKDVRSLWQKANDNRNQQPKANP